MSKITEEMRFAMLFFYTKKKAAKKRTGNHEKLWRIRAESYEWMKNPGAVCLISFRKFQWQRYTSVQLANHRKSQWNFVTGEARSAHNLPGIAKARCTVCQIGAKKADVWVSYEMAREIWSIDQLPAMKCCCNGVEPFLKRITTGMRNIPKYQTQTNTV